MGSKTQVGDPGQCMGTPVQLRPPMWHRNPALHVFPGEDNGRALHVEAKQMEERARVLGQQVMQALHK